MSILRYSGLAASGLEPQLERTAQALARGDFRGAQAKKLLGHSGLYRAKLSDSDRVVFTLLKHGPETCLALLEVVRIHD